LKPKEALHNDPAKKDFHFAGNKARNEIDKVLDASNIHTATETTIPNRTGSI